MTVIAASAPGKVMIAGEYAVLGGAPAIAMAVDRRARAHMTESASGHHLLEVRGHVDGHWSFRPAGNGAIEWIDAPPEAGAFKLFECLWRRRDIDAGRNWSITLDTSSFFDAATGQKYGLGSSAALSVAAAAVIGNDRSEEAAVATAAHREFQGGTGSGFDIATARNGGVVRFRSGSPVKAMPWPTGLGFRLLWSGQSADTRERLGRPGAASVDAGLIAAAERVASAWAAADVGDVLDSIRAYVACLESFDLDRGLGIFEAGHRQLADVARARADVIYKPCGAGGGDIGIALSASERPLAGFVAEAEERGHRLLDAALDPAGLVVEGPKSDD